MQNPVVNLAYCVISTGLFYNIECVFFRLLPMFSKTKSVLFSSLGMMTMNSPPWKTSQITLTSTRGNLSLLYVTVRTPQALMGPVSGAPPVEGAGRRI